jgi:hypothetical protein
MLAQKLKQGVQIFFVFILFIAIAPKNVSATGEVINAPASLTANLKTSSQLDGISITATGNPTLSIRLFVSNGDIELGTSTGLTINNDVEGTLEITGTLTDINAGLTTLSYYGNVSSDNLEITLTESGEIL